MDEIKEFRCKKCKEVIGLTDQKFLYAGGFAFSFKTTGICLNCGQVNCWRPLIPGCGKSLEMSAVVIGVKNG